MINYLISIVIFGVGTFLMYLLVTDRIVISSHDNESGDIAQFVAAIFVAIVTLVGVFIFSPLVGAILLILAFVAYRYFIEH